MFDVRGAIVAASAVLPLLALALTRHAGRWEAGARVPERLFAVVRSLPLFAPLPMATVENVASRLDERSYADGETIVVQGDIGDAFFVVDEGSVQVEVDEVPRRRLGPGEFFGEIALLRDVRRTATVLAVGQVSTLVIDREQFLTCVGGHARSAHVADTVVQDRLAADAGRPAG